MEYIITWNILLLGIYYYLEYIITWNILLLGTYYYLEYIITWNILLLGIYYYLEYIITWNILLLGINYYLEYIITWNIFQVIIYPEWPHREGGLPPMLKVARLIPGGDRGCTDLYYARGAHGTLPMRVGGATSQLGLPSLTPLSVASCGRLQLGVPHWATSVDYCK